MSGAGVEPVVASHARFPLVDGVRAIAALTIFAFHVCFYYGLLDGGVLGSFLVNLNVGVPIFFVVSGFLIYRPFVQRRVEGNAAPATAPYAIRRAMRIIPAYWIALIIVTLLLGTESQVFNLKGVIVYFGFLQAYDITTLTGGIGQAWTLSIEVTFYIAVPIWALAVSRVVGKGGARRVLRTEFITLAGLIAASIFWQLVVATSPRLSSGAAFAAQLSLPSFADQFAFGMVMAVISVAVGAGAAKPRWLAFCERSPWVWVVAGVGLYTLLSLALGGIAPEASWTDSSIGKHLVKGLIGVCVLAPAVFGAGLGGRVRGFLGWRPLMLIGLISYSFYLYHVVVIVKSGELTWLREIGWAAAAGVAFIVLVAVSTASYRLVEAPGIALGRRWAAKLAGRASERVVDR